MRLTTKTRELGLACCVIEGLKGAECWWLETKWFELQISVAAILLKVRSFVGGFWGPLSGHMGYIVGI